MSSNLHHPMRTILPTSLLPTEEALNVGEAVKVKTNVCAGVSRFFAQHWEEVLRLAITLSLSHYRTS